MTKEHIQQLANSGYSDYEIQDLIKANKKEYPTKPVKPVLVKNHTSEQAVQYANDLTKYELDIVKWELEYEAVDNYNSTLNFNFQEYLEEKSGLTSLSEKEQKLVMDLHYEFCSKDNGVIRTYQDLATLVQFVNNIKNL